MRLALQLGGTDAVALARELGLAGVAGGPPPTDRQEIEGALARSREAGLAICHWGVWQFNPLSPDRDAQAAKVRLLEQAIPIVADTGCPYLMVNGGNYHPNGFANGHPNNFTARALSEGARGLAPLCQLAERYGARIVIEPFIHCVVNTPERFLALKEQVGSDALQVSLDLCNFFNLEAMWQPEPLIRHVCETLAGHYAIVHVKDLRVSDGVHCHIDESPLGTGAMDWPLAFTYVRRDLPDDGWVVYEHAKSEQEVRDGVPVLRELAARAGVRFGRGAGR